jgi:hypothetical protein
MGIEIHPKNNGLINGIGSMLGKATGQSNFLD